MSRTVVTGANSGIGPPPASSSQDAASAKGVGVDYAVREGRIVNIDSVAGRVSLPLVGWYSASKHGLEALTDARRMQVEQFGFRVILIEPGSSGTAIWPDGSDDFPEPSDPAYAAAY